MQDNDMAQLDRVRKRITSLTVQLMVSKAFREVHVEKLLDEERRWEEREWCNDTCPTFDPIHISRSLFSMFKRPETFK